MKRDEASAILNMPEEQAITAILALAAKAEQYDRLHEGISPNTPSGMTPTYLKPNTSKRKKKPGRKKGHPGVARKVPETIHHTKEHTLQTCPHCNAKVNRAIRPYKRYIEDILPAEPQVTEHTINGYWCSSCRKIVSPVVTDAMPGATIGLRTIVYAAWLHYFIGVSLRNIEKILSTSAQFKVTPGGLAQAFKQLADLLTPYYEDIRQKIKNSAVLHADETGWRINGSSFWLWCFATRSWCYYVITKSRGSPVIKRVLGNIFNGTLICDFFGAYNKIDALAKQRCFFHLAGDLEKTDKHNQSDEWLCFRKKLYRLMNDAIRLSKNEDQTGMETFVRRTVRFHNRLDLLIEQSAQDRDVNRLQKRLSRHRDELFSFLIFENVSPYNNHAEQQIRRPVIMRKISQQNRSTDGAATQAILMSLFKSFGMQGLNPLETVLSLAGSAIAGIPDHHRMRETAA